MNKMTTGMITSLLALSSVTQLTYTDSDTKEKQGTTVFGYYETATSPLSEDIEGTVETIDETGQVLHVEDVTNTIEYVT
ncbi:hypothetical protein JCM19037_948 [Geomicrobium sp. JCM 19037]|uniref:hypothetical protein n=1 Tax=unclassified Geomicrobium TaxID=2628951 RepID=UPI00045F2B8B|nr:hypothetical protein [Geomicrobium sp. JCM 19037]GAK02695.1 hypothetical protein JCM19037_948 [Geomicrobium sp. JCM 19037]